MADLYIELWVLEHPLFFEPDTNNYIKKLVIHTNISTKHPVSVLILGLKIINHP